tara:strand:+ start:240 stop:494 length:255 start_codon:yes stop_codon:yes gene_type:complete
MAVKKKSNNQKMVIDLDGSQGNAFVLLGTAQQILQNSRMDKDTTKVVLDEMKSGDYVNLIKTFDKYFGTIVTLETSNQEYLDAF